MTQEELKDKYANKKFKFDFTALGRVTYCRHKDGVYISGKSNPNSIRCLEREEIGSKLMMNLLDSKIKSQAQEKLLKKYNTLEFEFNSILDGKVYYFGNARDHSVRLEGTINSNGNINNKLILEFADMYLDDIVLTEIFSADN